MIQKNQKELEKKRALEQLQKKLNKERARERKRTINPKTKDEKVKKQLREALRK